jgi:hypothetical protein
LRGLSPCVAAMRSLRRRSASKRGHRLRARGRVWGGWTGRTCRTSRTQGTEWTKRTKRTEWTKQTELTEWTQWTKRTEWTFSMNTFNSIVDASCRDRNGRLGRRAVRRRAAAPPFSLPPAAQFSIRAFRLPRQLFARIMFGASSAMPLSPERSSTRGRSDAGSCRQKRVERQTRAKERRS